MQSAPVHFLRPLAFLTCIFAAASAHAQTVESPTSAHVGSSQSVAVQAAKATQAAEAAPAATTSSSIAGDTVEPVTVRPQTPTERRVIASTDAASLTSPNFGPADAQSAPLAFRVGNNAAVGAVAVGGASPAGGFLHTNPDLARDPDATDAGLAALC